MQSAFVDDVMAVLVGVILGWGLGEGTRWLRQALAFRRLREAVRAECEVLLDQLPDLKDMIDQVVRALGNEAVLPAGHVHTRKTAYAAVVAAGFPGLKRWERNLLHVVYERLRVADEVLDRYARDLL